jgi:hypothetical protein
MNYIKIIKRMIALLIVSYLSISGIMAQVSDVIRLLDQSTNMPIVGATFQYGNQSGQSDEK